MKTVELRKKSIEELEKMVNEERGKLQQLKFDLAGGKVKNVREIRGIRRLVARIRTVIRQKQ